MQEGSMSREVWWGVALMVFLSTLFIAPIFLVEGKYLLPFLIVGITLLVILLWNNPTSNGGNY